MGRKNPKSMWWNDEVKAAVRRKELLGRRFWQLVMKRQKKDVWKRTEKKKVKRCIYRCKKKGNEQFGRKMNEHVNGNRKLFWKEVRNAK